MTGKPNKTAADYLVMSVSPALIMLLVGSLSYFLIQIFFHGAAVNNVRWVVGWFVLAVVLISRIAMEKSDGQAAIYGLALALATWFYLASVHPSYFLGIVLLATVWWCAHRLVWDCTLIDDEVDASGAGLLKSIKLKRTPKSEKPVAAKGKSPIPKAKPKGKPHAPGLSVIFFSLAALPIFGIGQKLLPVGDLGARHSALMLLFIYVTAAVGLLLTTSFLGLRRYLRQRHLEMPGAMVTGWIRFGVGVALFVLIGALLLPRPGVGETWRELGAQLDYRIRQASEYALKFSPHGKGKGRTGDEIEQTQSEKPSKTLTTQSDPTQKNMQQNPDQPSEPSARPEAALHDWFKIILSCIVAALIVWWLYRKQAMLLLMLRSAIAALKKFFRDLLGMLSWRSKSSTSSAAKRPKNPFAAYRNPFAIGAETSWSFEALVLYSFEALQAWSEQAGIKPRPEQTAREFCQELTRHFPEISSEVERLSFFYNHAAFGVAPPANYDLEPLKKLWRYLYGQ